MPWNCTVSRVVRRIVPLARSSASFSTASHCVGRQDAGRHPHPHHEAERLLHPLLAAFGAQVAVVLLIEAVEFCQLRVVVRQAPVSTWVSPSAIVPRRKLLLCLDAFVG